MTERIRFFAAGKDLAELKSLIGSMGLYLVPVGIETGGRETDEISAGYISVQPESELRVKEGSGTYCEVWNPMLGFYAGGGDTPGYFLSGWVDYTPIDRFDEKTRPAFRKISRWIRKNWPRPDDFINYCGPETEKFMRSEQIEGVDILPGTPTEYVIAR